MKNLFKFTILCLILATSMNAGATTINCSRQEGSVKIDIKSRTELSVSINNGEPMAVVTDRNTNTINLNTVDIYTMNMYTITFSIESLKASSKNHRVVAAELLQAEGPGSSMKSEAINCSTNLQMRKTLLGLKANSHW